MPATLKITIMLGHWWYWSGYPIVYGAETILNFMKVDIWDIQQR